ncbi:hypothetical protein [Endozoicomonas sp.]|uniref:hypothetical protein n=1 Tax=Endozoicomonas sp. TaxID=1892382 RepID=UPI003AF7292C
MDIALRVGNPASAAKNAEFGFHLHSFARLPYVPVKHAWWFPASWLPDRAASAGLNFQCFGVQGEKSGFF